jgi:hypothetical protein
VPSLPPPTHLFEHGLWLLHCWLLHCWLPHCWLLHCWVLCCWLCAGVLASAGQGLDRRTVDRASLYLHQCLSLCRGGPLSSPLVQAVWAAVPTLACAAVVGSSRPMAMGVCRPSGSLLLALLRGDVRVAVVGADPGQRSPPVDPVTAQALAAGER